MKLSQKSANIISIDSGTIFRTILILLGIFFLYYIRDVLVMVFVAFIIVSAIAPVVDYLERFYLPRSIATLIIYIIFGGGFIYFLTLLIPAVGGQLNQLTENLPNYLSKLSSFQVKFQYIFGSGELFQQEKAHLITSLSNNLNDGWWNIFSQAGSFLSGILGFLAVFSLSFYLSIQKKSVGKFLGSFIPEKHQEYATLLMERIQKKMGYWLLGQMVLNFSVGILVYLGLTILGVPYALLLAILAFAFEVIPYVGPILSSVAGVAVAFSVGPILALIVLAMYVIIQQLENHILVPLVMNKAVGIDPVAVIIAMLIGAQMGGVSGLILAIPITAVISVFLLDLIKKEEK